MKLKYRLIVAFLIIVFLPVFLALCLGKLLRSFVIDTLAQPELASEVMRDVAQNLQKYEGYENLITDFCVFSFVVLLFTAIVLVLWIYRGTAPKLHMLTMAAENIKNGNLDFSIKCQGNDEISQLCNSFEDMRKRLQNSAQESIEAEAEHKALISNIAHDLKTPITAIKGYAEGILDGVADTPEKQEKYIRTIYNKANDMNTLINELTLYAKIDTNRIPYNFTKLLVRDYFGSLIYDIGMDLENQHVTLDYINYVDEDVIVIGDSEQLGRVIGNIISNSVKYMRADVRAHINLVL